MGYRRMNNKFSLKTNKKILDYINNTELPTTLWLNAHGYNINKKGKIRRSSKKMKGGGNFSKQNNQLSLPVKLSYIGGAIENNRIKDLLNYDNRDSQTGGSLIQQINALSVPVVLWLVK